jgi:hypothetical protein
MEGGKAECTYGGEQTSGKSHGDKSAEKQAKLNCESVITLTGVEEFSDLLFPDARISWLRQAKGRGWVNAETLEKASKEESDHLRDPARMVDLTSYANTPFSSDGGVP